MSWTYSSLHLSEMRQIREFELGRSKLKCCGLPVLRSVRLKRDSKTERRHKVCRFEVPFRCVVPFLAVFSANGSPQLRSEGYGKTGRRSERNGKSPHHLCSKQNENAYTLADPMGRKTERSCLSAEGSESPHIRTRSPSSAGNRSEGSPKEPLWLRLMNDVPNACVLRLVPRSSMTRYSRRAACSSQHFPECYSSHVALRALKACSKHVYVVDDSRQSKEKIRIF